MTDKDLILEDGTPVSDLQSELRELKAQVQVMKQCFRAIGNLCNAPHWTAERRWRIEELARKQKL